MIPSIFPTKLTWTELDGLIGDEAMGQKLPGVSAQLFTEKMGHAGQAKEMVMRDFTASN